MNRQQRRNFVKKAKKKGFKKSDAELFLALEEMRKVADKEPKMLEDGTKVRVDVSKIRSRKEYETMSNKYKEYLNSIDGKVLTCRCERGNLYRFDGEPPWLFWGGDLVKVTG